MKFQPGMVRVCIEPKEDEPFIPDSWIEEKIFNLPYIETIEQSGASGYLIIAMFSSLRRAGEALPNLVRKIDRVMEQHAKRAKCVIGNCPESGDRRSSGEVFCDDHAWIADEDDNEGEP